MSIPIPIIILIFKVFLYKINLFPLYDNTEKSFLNMPIPTLSVIIITKNAATHIERCLQSVKFANEIIIVDSGSTDHTVDLCRKYTDKILIRTDWQGFGVQKNRALEKAQGDWVLSIDADEEIPPNLCAEMQFSLKQSQYTAFRVCRLSQFCGRWMKHSWSSDYVLRLFKRGCAQFTDDRVHEKLQLLQGTIGTLNNTLLHYSFSTVEEVLEKTNTYSTAGAQMQFERGKTASLKKAIFHGLWAFLRTYIFKKGFLDGREGFILAVSNAEGTYYRYIKLMYLNENVSKN